MICIPLRGKGSTSPCPNPTHQAAPKQEVSLMSHIRPLSAADASEAVLMGQVGRLARLGRQSVCPLHYSRWLFLSCPMGLPCPMSQQTPCLPHGCPSWGGILPSDPGASAEVSLHFHPQLTLPFYPKGNNKKKKKERK